MNIKSLLLGSAAAAVAFTGAQAADAIVIAEPEPLEYVRICDAYGVGYFYIPGTETCLRISGYARYQIQAQTGDDEWTKQSSVAVNFDARSDTEYGLLRGYIGLEAGSDYLGGQMQGINIQPSNDFNIFVNHAIIQLGGVWLGYTESLFSNSSRIAGGSGLGNFGGFTYADTFSYHYQQRQQVGYQFSGGNGFWAGVSLENDPGSGNFVPDVVGKIAYAQGWGGAWLTVGYDESADGVGVRGGIQGNFAPLTVRLDGYYQSNAAVTYGVGSRWAVQLTGLYQVNSKLGIAAGVEYRDRVVAGGVFTPADDWYLQLGVNWQPVTNLTIGADVTYRDLTDSTRGRIRFQRSF